MDVQEHSTDTSASIDGVSVKTDSEQGVLLAKQQHQKRFEENREVLKKSMVVYWKGMAD